MKQVITISAALVLLAGCAGQDWPAASHRKTPPSDSEAAEGAQGETAPAPEIAAPPPTARTVEEFDTTTKAQKTKAVANAAAGGGVDLGATIVSLGAPGEPGFWLKTPLVSAPAKGRVSYPVNGKSVEVDLIPIDGPRTAGSRISLAAMRLLGAPLTGLPEMRVYKMGASSS